MNIIFHIGTHKTASSSLQRFFTGHRELLAKNGYYYPPTDTGTKNFNYMPAQIAHGAKQFSGHSLDQISQDAKNKNCHSVLISAESFYAMTALFIDKQKRQRAHESYFENEASLITILKDRCSHYDDVKVVCYFRPQDEFAMSLYNQLVKSRFGLSCDYASFVEDNTPMFDYQGHIEQWERVFGKDNIHCQNFQSLKKNIIEDFCERFLTPEIYQHAERKEYFDNVRLTRDLLEYKRRFNKVVKDRALHHMATAAFMALSKTAAKEPPGYHIYAPFEKRTALFSDFKKGNGTLCADYNMEELPVLLKKDNSDYPGLSQQSASKISDEFRTWMKRPKNVSVFQTRKAINVILRKSPTFNRMLAPVRRYRSVIRHKLLKNR